MGERDTRWPAAADAGAGTQPAAGPTADASSPRLMIFGVTKLSDMLRKGNVWYVTGYRSYFASVDCVYLVGSAEDQDSGEGTRLVSLGSGSTPLDLVLAPLRLYRYARRHPADVYLTSDQVFSWWTGLGLRMLLGARVVLLPVALPRQLYADNGISLSGLPIPIERLMLWLSFKSATIVYTARAFGAFVDIFRADPLARDKLFVTDGMVESLPGPEFTAACASLRPRDRAAAREEFTLLYVGRLHREKLVDDLLQMMAVLKRQPGLPRTRLRLIGDGPDRARLEALADELGVRPLVEFAGARTSAEIPAEFDKADMLVSPLTGTTLREAALCGLPIIAYERDWIVGLLEDRETAMLVDSRDVVGLAAAVVQLAQDGAMRAKLSVNARALASALWTAAGSRTALSRLHVAVANRR